MSGSGWIAGSMANCRRDSVEWEQKTYFSEHNLRAIAEWLTTECVLTRPPNPLKHMMQTLRDKTSEQAYHYDPKQNHALNAQHQTTPYVTQAGQDIEDSLTSPPPGAGNAEYWANTSNGYATAKIEFGAPTFQVLLDCQRKLSRETLNQDTLVQLTCESLREVTGSAQALVYLWSEDSLSLHLVDPQRKLVEALPLDTGIAASVCSSQVEVVSEQPNTLRQHSPAVDTIRGEQLERVICCPVRDLQDHIIGAVEVNNKKAAQRWTDSDIFAVKAIAQQFGVSLSLCREHKVVVEERSELASVLSLVQDMQAAAGAHGVLDTIADQAAQLCNCETALLYLFEPTRTLLWTRLNDDDAFVSFGAEGGIVGIVAEQGSPILSSDVSHDSRHDADFDWRFGLDTQSVLAVPIYDSDSQVSGVLQLTNKNQGEFDDNDLRVVRSLLDASSAVFERPVIAHSIPQPVPDPDFQIGQQVFYVHTDLEKIANTEVTSITREKGTVVDIVRGETFLEPIHYRVQWPENKQPEETEEDKKKKRRLYKKMSKDKRKELDDKKKRVEKAREYLSITQPLALDRLEPVPPPTPAEIKQQTRINRENALQQQFESLDEDDSGELSASVAPQGIATVLEIDFSDEWQEQLLDEHNLDADSIVTVDEFVRIGLAVAVNTDALAAREARRVEWQAQFSAMDVDGVGSVSVDQLHFSLVNFLDGDGEQTDEFQSDFSAALEQHKVMQPDSIDDEWGQVNQEQFLAVSEACFDQRQARLDAVLAAEAQRLQDEQEAQAAEEAEALSGKKKKRGTGRSIMKRPGQSRPSSATKVEWGKDQVREIDPRK